MPQPIAYLDLVWGDRQSPVREALARRYQLLAENEASLSFRGEVAREPAEIEARFTGGHLAGIVIRIDITDREPGQARSLLASLLDLYAHRHGAAISRTAPDPGGSPDAHGGWRDGLARLRLETVTEAGRRSIVIAYAREGGESDSELN